MVIESGGDVGIGGATSPTLDLSIGDNDSGIQVNGTDKLIYKIGGVSALKLGEGTGERVQIHGGLALHNADTGNGSNYLRWDSTSKKVSIYSSTLKLKKDIVTLPPEIYNSILELNPVSYRWRNNDSAEMGFIAEEIASIHPTFAGHGVDYKYNESGSLNEIPIYGDDGTLSHTDYELDSDNMVPVGIETNAILAAAVAKIQELEERIKVLEG